MLTVLIVVAITTLCICDLTVLGLVASYVYNNVSRPRSVDKSPAPVSEDSMSFMTQSENEEQKKARAAYIAQERAFQDMLNFNAEQAYGIADTPKEE